MAEFDRPNRRTSRKWLRFSLATLMVLTACVAGFLTGYRRGYHQGRDVWELMPTETRVYAVGDLAPYRSTSGDHVFETLNDIAEYIRSTIAPISWDLPAGNGGIGVWSERDALVIGANQYVHEQIADLLESLGQQAVRTAAVDADHPSR